MTPKQEEKLIRKLRQRDEDAFRQLVLLYQKKVFLLVFRMIADRQEAEDISQEVFITVFKNIESFRGESKFSTWLFRISTNLCKNRLKYLKRRARGRTQPIDKTSPAELTHHPLSNSPSTPDKVAQGHQLEGVVQRALQEIDDEFRVLIVLRDIQGLPYNEIGDITGLNQGTVKRRLHRARAALRTSLAHRRRG